LTHQKNNTNLRFSWKTCIYTTHGFNG